MRRAKLAVSRDVYGKHFEELTDEELGRLNELIALRVLENEEIKEISK